MTILGRRSGSQILRTFLPQQTADLKGSIYRVTEWTSPTPITVDHDVVSRRLLRDIAPWTNAGKDSEFAADIRRGVPIEVVELDDRRGVSVERFPQVWLCRHCKRIGRDLSQNCRCSFRNWGQLHFVGVHSCGAIFEPFIKRCPAHDDVRLVSPRSAQAKDLSFECPECEQKLMTGLGFRKCTCGQGQIRWNVHKARSVYVPRGTVVVNPPRPQRMRELLAAGGTRRALAWIIEGMSAASPAQAAGKPTRGTLIESLIAQGFDKAIAEKMAAMAAEESQLAAEDGTDDIDLLPPDRREEAAHYAVDVAMALAESRLPSASLIGVDGVDEVLASRYASDYPAAIKQAGLTEVELVERFPILNLMYGYTRGGDSPTDSRLVPFRRPQGGYRLHGDLAETEALYFRLDSLRVARWLTARGHALAGWDQESIDQRQARLAVLTSADMPAGWDEPDQPTIGSDLLSLIHSLSHRVIRQIAVYAGIERDALSEYLIPLHLGFFVYAAACGDFVLGGLQAVFETELSSLLHAVVNAEHRCALDPGCARGAGACLACLHVGEPSCRHFNTYLDRRVLFGPHAYLTAGADR